MKVKVIDEGHEKDLEKSVNEFLSSINADIVDINMGCPAPKVVKNGDGSKLLLNLELAESKRNNAISGKKFQSTSNVKI